MLVALTIAAFALLALFVVLFYYRGKRESPLIPFQVPLLGKCGMLWYVSIHASPPSLHVAFVDSATALAPGVVCAVSNLSTVGLVPEAVAQSFLKTRWQVMALDKQKQVASLRPAPGYKWPSAFNKTRLYEIHGNLCPVTVQ